jgi:hypothetical protein
MFYFRDNSSLLFQFHLILAKEGLLAFLLALFTRG